MSIKNLRGLRELSTGPACRRQTQVPEDNPLSDLLIVDTPVWKAVENYLKMERETGFEPATLSLEG